MKHLPITTDQHLRNELVAADENYNIQFICQIEMIAKKNYSCVSLGGVIMIWAL